VSVETVVVFSRAKIVSPQEWQLQISGIQPGLVIDTDFEPLEFDGFLPCKLLGQDCGFEYSLDELDEDSREELGPHLESEWDSVLTLVSRSELADCQSAVIAAAAFTVSVGGSVLGDEDELLHQSTTLEWAQRVVESLMAAEAEEREAGARRERALEAGADSALMNSLAEMTGRDGMLLCQMGMLSFVSTPDLRISSGAWETEVDGKNLSSCRYAALRDEQLALLSSVVVSDRFHELDERLDAAGELDEADTNRLLQLLPALGAVSVKCARYNSPGQITIEFSGAQPITARWYGLGTSSLSLSAAGLRWTITKEGACLS
jgi:hypothetical protein